MLASALFAGRLDRIVQQQPVAAAHHLDPMRDKAASLVLAWIDLEILLAAAKSEQDFGNAAIAFPAKAGVERTQGQYVPLPELRGQFPEVTPRPMTLERSHQALSRMGAEIIECVRRQNRAIKGRGIGNGVRQPELMRDAIDLPDAVPSILSLAQIETVEMRKRDDGFGVVVMTLQRRKPYGLRLETRTPEQRLPIRRGFRIGRKIATPSAARRLPGAPGLAWSMW